MLPLSLEKKLSDKQGGKGKVVEGQADPHAGGQSPPQEAVGARARRCPATRVSLTASDAGTLGRTRGRRHMAMAAWGENCGAAGTGRAAQRQREGHQSYTGDGARGAELRGFGNRDELSLKTAVLRMWWKN